MSGHIYKKSVLDNGFEIHTLQIPFAEKAYIDMHVKSGAAHEQGTHGTAHYLEHMLGYGSERYQEKDLLTYFADLGGTYNFRTGMFDTYYFANALPAKGSEYIKRISSVLTAPSFTPDHVEKERVPILTEELGISDASRNDIYFPSMEKLYPSHRASKTVIATQQDIANITYDDLVSYHRANYVAPNMFMVATGAVNHDDMVAKAAAGFDGLSRNPLAIPKIEPMDSAFGSHYHPMDKSAINLLIGFKGVMRAHQSSHVEDVARQMLGYRLYDALREDLKIVYGAGAETWYYPDHSQLMATTVVDPSRFEQATDVIFATLEEFARDFSPKDISRFLAKEEEWLADFRNVPIVNGEKLADAVLRNADFSGLDIEMKTAKTVGIDGFKEAIHDLFARKAFLVAAGPVTAAPELDQRLSNLRHNLGIVSQGQKPYIS